MKKGRGLPLSLVFLLPLPPCLHLVLVISSVITTWGAFFSDERTAEPSVFSRDFQQPTGEDRTVDRQLLPKVLQVKRFGLKGRSKYTHLTDQDTSRRGGEKGTGHADEQQPITAREVGVRGYRGQGAGRTQR